MNNKATTSPDIIALRMQFASLKRRFQRNQETGIPSGEYIRMYVGHLGKGQPSFVIIKGKPCKLKNLKKVSTGSDCGSSDSLNNKYVFGKTMTFGLNPAERFISEDYSYYFVSDLSKTAFLFEHNGKTLAFAKIWGTLSHLEQLLVTSEEPMTEDMIEAKINDRFHTGY